MSLYDDLAELTMSAELAVWASTVTFTPQGGSPVSVSASVYEDSSILEADGGRESWIGQIQVKGAIATLGTATKGDTITWRDLEFRVREIDGRDAGGIVLTCERVAPRKETVEGARKVRT